jgi:hypothetical protein
MPVEVRIGSRIVTVPMADGRGSVELPAGAAAGADYTLDPRSKILRRELRIERFQQYREEQRKNKAV